MIVPFRFQAKAIRSVISWYVSWFISRRKILLVSPTGSGKTEMAFLIAQQLKAKRILYLGRTLQLVDQTAERAYKYWDVGIVNGTSRQWDKEFVCCTYLSLDISRCKEFDLIIFDECHRLIPYQQMINKLMAQSLVKCKLLGLTATPKPENYKYFEATVLVTDSEVLAEGRQAKRIDSNHQILSISELYQLWFKMAKDRRTIIFCKNQSVANFTANFFSLKGVKAYAITSDTHKDERNYYIKYAQILTTVEVLAEGSDLPLISCIISIAPIKKAESYWRKIQQDGRGLRSDTRDCLILACNELRL